MRGWKLRHLDAEEEQKLAGHSAPTMRGWKPSTTYRGFHPPPGRTLSPDNEGMETCAPVGQPDPGLHRRTLSPDNEGMET